ncbi:MAG: hypothetical protein HGA54_02320, partial [Actinobacteria bacterium]|nr:hypothetical protein [Actinomycetota bacterium]
TRLYALKHKLPLFEALPISKTKIDWEEGRIAPPLVACDLAEYNESQKKSLGNITLYQTLITQLTRYALTEVENRIETEKNRDALMREILKLDSNLNQRQRNILGRALRVPQAEFQIRYHQINHGIAYTTARRDLLELEERGYLSVAQRGKTFVFVPTQNLQELSSSTSTKGRA